MYGSLLEGFHLLALDFVPSLVFEPPTPVNAFPIQASNYPCSIAFLLFFKQIPVSCGDWDIDAPLIHVDSSSMILSRCYVTKGSYFKLFTDVFESRVNALGRNAAKR